MEQQSEITKHWSAGVCISVTLLLLAARSQAAEVRLGPGESQCMPCILASTDLHCTPPPPNRGAISDATLAPHFVSKYRPPRYLKKVLIRDGQHTNLIYFFLLSLENQEQ